MLNCYLKTLKSQLQNPKIGPNFQNRSVHNPAIQFVLNEAQNCQSSNTQRNCSVPKEGEEEFSPQKQQAVRPSIQISHPWREWVDLMEKLMKNGYFDEIGNPFANKAEVSNKEANLIRTACLNFARDQYQLIRDLSREDIMVIAGSGCPSTDRKVVNSGKRIRAHVGIHEGDVCSSCVLRGDCDRAYVKAREDEGGRTVDVMRFLLTYGLDPVIGSVENKPSLNKKVKESVRRLLKEMVDFKVCENDHELPKATTQESDSKQERRQIVVPLKKGDWVCPTCDFVNFARNVKCLRCDCLSPERLKTLSEEQEHLPLKKGDWICDKCNFLNFARNTQCKQCKENPPKRQLHPGEWECDSCNYINFKRNMVCLKCDHRRPIASNAAHIASQPVIDNSVKDLQAQPWHEQERSTRRNKGGDSFQFVNDEDEDQIGSSSWNQAPGFKDFPVLGGKSDLSCDVQKHESWKMEMAAKSRNAIIHKSEDSGRHESYIFGGTRKYSAPEEDDDDMAEWFGS